MDESIASFLFNSPDKTGSDRGLFCVNSTGRVEDTFDFNFHSSYGITLTSRKNFDFRSPYHTHVDSACYVFPDGHVGVDGWIIGSSYGRSSPDLDDFYIALYVFPDGDISSDYSRNIGDSYGIFKIL